MHPKRRSTCVQSVPHLLALAGLAAVVPSAHAAQYVLTVQSTFLRDDSYSETFDGADYGTLPFYPLDNARLAGGTMRERFIISDVTTATSGSGTAYTFEPSSDWTYDLFDPLGHLVHHGSASSDGFAYVQNNLGSAPFTTDQVLISANFAAVTQMAATPPEFTPFLSIADLSCFGYIGPGVDYLTDLSLPLDPSVYLSFPAGQVITDAVLAVGTGDIVNFTGPYAYSSSQLVYSVNSLSIVPIPEPSSLSGAALGTLMLVRRRRQ